MKTDFVETDSTEISVRPMPQGKLRWLNRTVLGIGLASLFSDSSHEMATSLMPAFLATMGVAALWLGLIEGISDGLSSFAKIASGYYTDRLRRRKPVAVLGYIITALGTAAFSLATAAWHVLLARSAAWFGRTRSARSLGLRVPTCCYAPCIFITRLSSQQRLRRVSSLS
jgi:MFS family permease